MWMKLPVLTISWGSELAPVPFVVAGAFTPLEAAPVGILGFASTIMDVSVFLLLRWLVLL